MNKKNKTNYNKLIKSYIQKLKQCIDSLDTKKINSIVNILMNAYAHNKHVFILGNGGSASNASHMACDLSKGTLQKICDDKEPRFRVISLTDNVAVMTAFSNDLSYDDIFVQQLRNLVNKNDVVISLSASGNSKNIIKAILYANKCSAKTIGFFGFGTGGKAAKIVDLPIIINSYDYGHCEDVQLILNHIITTCIAKIKHSHDKKINNEKTK